MCIGVARPEAALRSRALPFDLRDDIPGFPDALGCISALDEIVLGFENCPRGQ